MPEVLPRSLRPVHAGSISATAARQGGLGIGLALVQAAGRDARRRRSRPQRGAGKGSEFIVRLPRQARRVRGRGAFDGERAAAGTGALQPGLRRILVADDNLDALETWHSCCSCAGTRFTRRPDGVQALEAATRTRPDLVLLDIGMPGMDGYEVARRIRSQPWGREATLVALTGWGQENDRRRSREAGFDSHCIKPLDMQRLLNLLASLPAAGGPRAPPAARAGE